MLHWKPADDRKSTHRYDIQVNGTIVGHVSHADTSIVISNLRPQQLYIVRVITVNSVDFRAASEPIRVYTKPADSADFFAATPTAVPADQSATGGPITVRPVKPFPDSASIPPTPPPLIRETSSGPAQPRKSLITRRPSRAVLGIDTQQPLEDGAHEPLQGESQQAFTEKLDEIGRETLDIERQIQDEEHEAAQARTTLGMERDALRADLKDKEDTSRDLRKQVSTLERNNQTAQNKRNAQEKILLQKKAERQKLKDDAIRWESDVSTIHADLLRIQDQKRHLLDDVEREKSELHEKQDHELNILKTIEDENRDIGAQIKQLERDTNSSPSNAEPNEHNDALAAQEADEDRYWHERLHAIEEQYIAAAQAMDTARRLCYDATNNLNIAKQRHADLSHMSTTVPIFEQSISRASSLHHRRPRSGPNATLVAASQPPAPSFPAHNAPPFTNGVSSVSPSYATNASPFFNINNGMTLERHTNDFHFSDADVEKLTGGAPMSPGAGADLLPADLLSIADDEPLRTFLGPAAQPIGREDSDGDSEATRPHSTAQMLPGLGALPGLGVIPGLGASRPSDLINAPASPASVGSHSPSVFASPGVSASNLAFGSPDNPLDSDRRSIRSSRSTRATSGSLMHGGSRFTQILGLDKLNRQRGKTVSEEGPALGSLTKSHSQSMPRQSEEDPEEPANLLGRRRNSSHSANFFGGMLSRTPAASKPTAPDPLPSQKHVATRRRPFNMFGSKTDGWAAILGSENRPSSPRPGSTHSTELPRPSGDSTNWGFWPTAAEPFGQRSSPLSSDWISPHANTTSSNLAWGSRHQSRRPSIQHGASSGLPDYILEDDADVTHDDSPIYFAPLPPIGTKPAQFATRPPSPKLNPAAKDFKSLFSRGDRKSRRDEGDRRKEQDTDGGDASTPLATPYDETESVPFETLEMHIGEPQSPTLSRKSRDNRSIITADSSINEYSSRDSLDRSVSYTPSEAPTPSSVSASGSNKESFMAKLTRKSSSGKFGLPVFSRDKKQRSQRDQFIVGEDDEDALARSMDSITKDDKRADRGSVRSWSSMFAGKKAKGKDKAEQTPSLSEASGNEEFDDEI